MPARSHHKFDKRPHQIRDRSKYFGVGFDTNCAPGKTGVMDLLGITVALPLHLKSGHAIEFVWFDARRV